MTVAAESTDWLIRASDLKRQRGWTESLVVALLGAPDALSPNPHGFRAPMRWYREDRVRDAEASQTFRDRADRLAAQANDAGGVRGAHDAAGAGDAVAEHAHDAVRAAPSAPSLPPLRCSAPDTIEHLEWLDDAAHLALFHTPRRPRMRRPRRPALQPAQIPIGQRFEVLRLF
jgi:hypothetical protein